MKKLAFAALALASVAAFAAAPAVHAQGPAPAAAASGSIVGFSSIPWGASERQVVERYGQPTQVTPLGNLRVLVYSDQVLGQDVTTWYYMHPQDGLIAGAYVAPYTFGNSCWDIYTKFKDAISERYSNIRPQVQEENQARSLDMCSAIGINRASASTTWDDRQNGARAFVMIVGEDKRYVQTMYLSADGIRDINDVNAGERKDRF